MVSAQVELDRNSTVKKEICWTVTWHYIQRTRLLMCEFLFLLRTAQLQLPAHILRMVFLCQIRLQTSNLHPSWRIREIPLCHSSMTFTGKLSEYNNHPPLCSSPSRLIFATKQLADGSTVSDYNVQRATDYNKSALQLLHTIVTTTTFTNPVHMQIQLPPLDTIPIDAVFNKPISHS